MIKNKYKKGSSGNRNNNHDSSFFNINNQQTRGIKTHDLLDLFTYLLCISKGLSYSFLQDLHSGKSIIVVCGRSYGNLVIVVYLGPQITQDVKG